MFSDYKDYFVNSGFNYCTPWIKRKVPNEVLSKKFTAYLSNDVANVACDLNEKERYMVSTEKMIELMKAYLEGKTIQCKKVTNNDDWYDWYDCNPAWDWTNFEYRVKPEPTYRPYKGIEEMLEDIKKRLVAIQHPVFSGIWLKLKDKDGEEMIVGIDHANSEILLGKDWNSLKIVFEHFIYLDGTPFGIKE